MGSLKRHSFSAPFVQFQKTIGFSLQKLKWFPITILMAKKNPRNKNLICHK